MIKAGIIGGSNPMAGELVRLLINHPDVEIMWVDSARFTGRLVSDVHHGLLGDTMLRISPSSSNHLSDIDVLFIFRHRGQTVEWFKDHPLPDGLRVVDLSVDMRDSRNAEAFDFVYGLPELNRKAMVRGARRAVVPHPAANIVELALLPLAKSGNLPAAVCAALTMPAACEPIEDSAEVEGEIQRALASLMPESEMSLTLAASEGADERAMTASVTFDCDLDIGEIMRDYEEFYDDHNFTFVVTETPAPKEVEGTNKCLMRIDKTDGHVVVSATMDAMLKGSAGTAVHDMNLLFGLHERVGLALKASQF